MLICFDNDNPRIISDFTFRQTKPSASINNRHHVSTQIDNPYYVFRCARHRSDFSMTQYFLYLHDIDAIVAEHYPDFEIVWFGHIGDGNLHLNILKPESLSKDEFFARCATVNKWVFEIVQKYNGSISAEHGVGMTKRDYLSYSRSEAEIALMKAVKQVFDPNGIMNPGKIFP